MKQTRNPFTVAIVNFNGGAILPRCVQSVVASGVEPADVVIVDNGSSDGSESAVKAEHPELRVIRMGCNAGFARAANAGLLSAGTQLGIILNNDALLTAETLAALARAMDADPLLAVAGAQLIYPDGSLQRSTAPFPRVATEALPKFLRGRFGGRFSCPVRPLPALRYVESTIGALFCVRMAYFRQLGGFDAEYFFYMEETDYCKRAWDAGYRVALIEDAVVTHLQGATAKRHAVGARIEYQRSRLIYFRKHFSRPAYWLMRVLAPLKSALNALGMALLCAATLFLLPRARDKARQNAAVLIWYLSLSPSSWGLPGKCAETQEAGMKSRSVERSGNSH